MHEAPRRRRYYGEERPFLLPGFRLGVGLGAWLAGARADRAHFALDAQAFARVGLHRGRTQAALYPALGYSLGAGQGTREHLLVAGLGLGFLDRTGGLAVVPAFVVGAAERTQALGMRTSLIADLLGPKLVLEVAHQVLFLETRARHELRLTLNVDLLRAFMR